MQAAYTGKNASTAPNATMTFTGLSDALSANEFVVFPNPASDQINVILNEASGFDLEYKLLNQFGNVVYEGAINKGAQGSIINTSNLLSGVYFIKMHNTLKKIVIVK